ncbi:serine/threonine-protein kinase 11-interacting protein [Salarias fasciatus]|uniref:Serine/threonine-protein kinase 11-interacting protein n=1 Tax=Salarias fasciatus TaxID=181472 RepID=A0A672GBV4_SALFA|nr:serine/threonine-protein kinase 11-interacting protein [Salarias fasciatus]
MAASHTGQSSLVHSLAKLLRNDGDVVLDGSSTLALPAAGLQQLTRLFEQYLLPRAQQHGFLALPSHPADTAALLQLQFLFDVLQKTVSLKLVNPPGNKIQSVVKIFPFKSLKCLELKRIPPHCLEGLRGIYSQLEVFTCSRSLSSLEELLSLCGGDLSSALPWLELHTLNFSYNALVCLDQSLSLLNVLKSLDLSHNKIQECAEFLKPLSELEHLNLGYNCLQRAPVLGPGARAKLVTLILRNNELETINGVEQLSSLRHLDVAYNLLLEHSQLAPLALLHCLTTLTLEGNPLFFQKTHRTCTVRHLSPKAAGPRFKLDGTTLLSSELSILPKPGQHVVQAYAPPPVATATERGNQEASSGAGELSDSQSHGEAAVSSFRKKKSRSKVKVRRASISEPSDTDYVPRSFSSSQAIVLPHQQEIERMSSFRDQLGEDWLRYQHHLEDPAPPPPPPTIANGIDETEAIPEKDGDLETESTLQWPGSNTQLTDSTLEEASVDGAAPKKEEEEKNSSPASRRSSRAASGETNQEEEDLGVDLCHPLLAAVLPDGEEEEEEEAAAGPGRRGGSGDGHGKVFLRVKQGLLLELDVQRGRERRRLELDSLLRVERAEQAWSREGSGETLLPALELGFDYISREKQRRRYVLLDDDPAALQALIDILSSVAEENRRRDSELSASRVRLQCLRCRAEFSRQGAGKEEEEEEEEEDEEDRKEKADICPECGGDHVVQVALQSAPPYSSTPVHQSSEDDLPRTASVSGSPVRENTADPAAAAAAAAEEEPEFVTAQGSSFFIGDGSSLSKEELAGSYSYAAADGTPPPLQPEAPPSPDSLLDLLSEDSEAVDHRLKLFLDVEVFEDEDEELSCLLKMSAVKFGEPGEIPSLLVVSNRRIYFLEMTSDATGHLGERLQKRAGYPLLELGHLEVGLASQTIHMEFGQKGGVAYTLLVRDSARCKRFYSTLTEIVRKMAHKSDSKLQSISTTRLTPEHHLWPLVCEDNQADVEDGQLQFFYILAFVLRDGAWAPLTVLATRKTLHLLEEDHQWSRGSPAAGCHAILETLPISCLSSVLLWPEERRRLDFRLYDETVKQEQTWSVRSDSGELLQGLLCWVRAQWEAMFSVRLHTSLQGGAA